MTVKTQKRDFPSIPIAREFQRGKSTAGHNTRFYRSALSRWVIYWSPRFINLKEAEDAS